MARHPSLSVEKQESLRRYVEEDRATPKELAMIFGVTPATIYNYLHRLGLPICKAGDYRKFYDPAWELPRVPCPKGTTLSAWGPWVSVSRIPKNECHPTVGKANALPVAAMLLAEHHLRRIPDLLRPCVKFTDGNPENVSLDNLALVLSAIPTSNDSLRSQKIRDLAAKERANVC